MIKAWSDSRLAGVALFLEVGDYQLFRVRVVSIEQLDTDAYICSSNIYFGIIMYHACMLASAEETGGYVVGLHEVAAAFLWGHNAKMPVCRALGAW